MITQEQVEQLSRLRSPEYPVTSLFLNLNGGRDARKSNILLKDLVKARRDEVHGLSRHQQTSVERDFEQIERFVHGYDRKGARAVAIFSSSGAEMWQVFPLARMVQDRLVIDRHPHVRPLSRLLNEFKRCGVILLSRDHATIDSIHMGEIMRLRIMQGDVDSQIRESGFHGYSERRIERHSDGQLHHFLKEVAAQALAQMKHHGFDHVIIGGSIEPMSEFESVAHTYIRDKTIGRLPIGPDAPAHEVVEHASAVVLAYEDQRARELVETTIDRATHDTNRSALGLRATLDAISIGRVATLLVAKGVLRPGVACAQCVYLGLETGECPHCGADVLSVPDIIEEAIDRALSHSTEVLFVAGHDRLMAEGGLAATLRY